MKGSSAAIASPPHAASEGRAPFLRVQVTNNGITEEYTVGAKTFSVAASTTTDAIYFGLTTHQPSNKKTELAPGGLQSVVLGNATLEHADNTFVRISPQEPKTLEVQGLLNI